MSSSLPEYIPSSDIYAGADSIHQTTDQSYSRQLGLIPLRYGTLITIRATLTICSIVSTMSPILRSVGTSTYYSDDSSNPERSPEWLWLVSPHESKEYSTKISHCTHDPGHRAIRARVTMRYQRKVRPVGDLVDQCQQGHQDNHYRHRGCVGGRSVMSININSQPDGEESLNDPSQKNQILLSPNVKLSIYQIA